MGSKSVSDMFSGWIADALAWFGVAFDFGKSWAVATLIDEQQVAWHYKPVKALSAQEVAAAVVKGEDTTFDAVNEASLNGISAERLQALVNLTGNPPGPEQLMAWLRQGKATTDNVRRGVRQGFIKNEWVDFYLRDLHYPISAQEAVQAAVQGHMSKDDAANVAEQSGVWPSDFEILYQTAGSPPGDVQMLELWQRGFISEARLDQGLRESRLKDDWIPDLKRLAQKFPPERSVVHLITTGAISDAEGRHLLTQLGYAPAVIDALIRAGHTTKTAATKELSVATVRSLYTDRVITRDVAVSDLVKLKYTTEQANEILDLADGLVMQSYHKAAVSRIHSLYVQHHIEAPQASTDLDSIGTPPDQRDHLLTLWALERAANVKTLSLGQLNSAYKKGIIDLAEFTDRVVKLGYTPADALILSSIDVPPAPA